MNREQLAHVVRAAATIAADGDILVLGSQSVLGSWDVDELPEATTLSIEADIAFFNDPDGAKKDAVDGAIGNLSSFQGLHGYYGEGVSLSVALLPAGWRDRVVPFERPDAEPGMARCLEPHDLVVAKLAAGRPKDRFFAVALIDADLVDPDTLYERAATLDRPKAVCARVADSIKRCVTEAVGDLKYSI